jgi:transcriptional regulator NrdR family protein
MPASEPSLTILKRTPGKSEPYDERKLYASIKAVCLAARRPAGEAEDTAAHVCKDIRPWLKTKQEITSLDIRAHAYSELRKLSPKAASIYKRRHRIMA